MFRVVQFQLPSCLAETWHLKDSSPKATKETKLKYPLNWGGEFLTADWHQTQYRDRTGKHLNLCLRPLSSMKYWQRIWRLVSHWHYSAELASQLWASKNKPGRDSDVQLFTQAFKTQGKLTLKSIWSQKKVSAVFFQMQRKIPLSSGYMPRD